MTNNVRSLLRQARMLRPEEKLELVNALITELDRPDPVIEKAWGSEAKRRLAAMRNGRMRTYLLVGRGV